MKAGPLYHPHLTDDIDLLLKRHAASSEALQAREVLLKQLQNAITHAFGPHCQLVDLTFSPAHTILTNMRVELAVVDRLTPDGALPPIIATPKLVATLRALDLQVISDPSTARTTGLYVSTSPSASPSTPGKLLPGLQLILNYSLPFALTRLRLFECYFALHPNLPALFSVARLWLDSHSLNGISPTSLASLCIGYLQMTFGLPHLQRREVVEGVRQDELRSVLTNEARQWQVRPLPLGELLVGWLRYFGRRFRSKQSAVCIQSGGLVHSPATNSTLRVYDPFKKSHNHANLSPADTARFVNLAKTATDTLEKARPLREVFGPALPNPKSPRMGVNPRLAQDIWTLYESNQPTPQTLENRRKIIRHINRLIRDNYGEVYEVMQFGSTGYGVDTDSSDLDLMICDHERPTGFSPNLGNLARMFLARGIGKILRKAGFLDILAIPTASVPIVKCRDRYTNIKIDINCNELLGLRNTELLAHYCNLYHPLRPMIFFLKRWARSYGLNDPGAQTGPPGFSSYCLALMTVAYLQTRNILPSLQACFDGTPADRDQHGVWLRVKGKPPVWCDTRWKEASEWVCPDVSLEEAVYGWFKFWGSDIDYARTGVDIRLGKTFERERDGRVNTPTSKKGRKGKRGDSVTNAAVLLKDMKLTEPNTPVTEASIEIASIRTRSDSVATTVDSIPVGEVQMAQEELNTLRAEVESVPSTNGKAANFEQPVLWRSHGLLVVDPFIRAKNVAGNVAFSQIELLRMNCRHTIEMLENGLPLDRIMGDFATEPPVAEPMPLPPPMPFGRGRGRGGGRGRGRGRGRSD
ncbi:PAP associated domain containing 4 [Ceratobasidium sp. AG-Ba]|nr:PAP associated domain containing 4 [Ceratobasidium sp. AG-Ba]